MPTFDLLGHMLPDDFSRSLPSERPMMKYEKPHAAPRTCEIEIRDNARVLCRGARDKKTGVVWAQGSRVARSGGTPSGATSPGRDAMLGWGDKAAVNGLAACTPTPKVKGPEVVTRDLTRLGSTLPDYEGA